jgi:hypothetical protein
MDKLINVERWSVNEPNPEQTNPNEEEDTTPKSHNPTATRSLKMVRLLSTKSLETF